MCLLRISKHYIINNQGRSQTSEQDEASLERRSREPLRETGDMPRRENFEIERLRNALSTDPIFLGITFSIKRFFKKIKKAKIKTR